MKVVQSTYLPHPKQLRFHKAPEKYRLFLAGIGTGKTIAGVHEALRLCHVNPHSDGCIIEPTYAMIRDVMMPVWEEFVPKQFYRHYKSENRIQLWTGQSIFLRSCENPERIRGLNLAWAWGDEIAQVPTDTVWRILQGRIRDPRAKHRSLFATTTPRGWNWLAKLFLRATSKNYRWIRAKTSDNPHLPPDFVAGLREDYGEEFARQELDAEILELCGLVWPINPRVHLRVSPETARQICHTFYGGIDWGYTNPTALVVAGVDGEGRWYLVDEWYERRQLMEDIEGAIRQLHRKWPVQTWYADPAEPDRIKHLRKAGIRTKPAVRAKGAGLTEVRSLLAVRGDGKPRMHVCPHLKRWLKEQEEYHYIEETEDVEGDNGDHIMDATRYMVHSVQSKKHIRGKMAA